MADHDSFERYRAAIAQFEAHLHWTERGTIALDATDGESIGIFDQTVFAHLKWSLDETNRKLLRGEIDRSQIRWHSEL